ncbi:ribosome recycling factor [bacterium (Candidatus Torokbacteria) CG_4_10_14_0_2_um_filter_35_8]|nr:MAG: ribosome recycling factor [bacterium (Candidatus Torokbacteria) CG_4_10_14_0_2_um_filter_35_8]
MYQELIKDTRPKIENIIDFIKDEVKSLRTGRATSVLVENIEIEAYGVKNVLNSLASISIPSARQIVIKPWDKNVLKNIEEGIKKASLNLSPINDGKSIKINLPELTSERREELVKILQQKIEDARIGIRNIREDVWKIIQGLKKDGSISEDEKFNAKSELEKMIKGFEEQIERIKESKEKEIRED